MRAPERAIARKNLDKKLKIMQNTEVLARPPRGWIKAIREALGMTSAQLARRLGVSQPRVLAKNRLQATSHSMALEAQEWAFSRKRDVLDEKFLNNLHKQMYGGGRGAIVRLARI